MGEITAYRHNSGLVDDGSVTNYRPLYKKPSPTAWLRIFSTVQNTIDGGYYLFTPILILIFAKGEKYSLRFHLFSYDFSATDIPSLT